MKSEILNKRKQWLDSDEAKRLDLWTKKADDLNGFEGSLKYFGIEQRGNRFEIDSSDSNQYFHQSIALFKLVLQKQIAKENTGLPSLEQPPDYDALISILGFSPEPLLHTILALTPKKVYPVATEESARYYKVSLNTITRKRDGNIQYFEAIIEQYKDKEPSQRIIVEPIARNVASIGSLDTFNRVREIIQTVRKDNSNAKIALDVTGGKKSADVAAFLVGAIENEVDIFYVDFEQYEQGKPKCGTEFLNKLDNPYDIYTVKEEQLVKSFWEKGNYAAVKELVASLTKNSFTQDVAKRYSLEGKYKKYIEIGKTATCYEAWNRFDYKEAMSFLFDGYDEYHDRALDELGKCPKVFVEGECCRRENAKLALMLAVDRYKRGFDAARFKEWNRAALCYMQATEALLRFSYSESEKKMLKSKSREYYANNLLKKLFGFKYNDDLKEIELGTDLSDSFFKNDDLCIRLQKYVLSKRNELSHYECVLHNGENDMIEKMIKKMDAVVKEFLELFTEKYKIEEKIVSAFCKQVSFLQLDNDLQFMTPE